MALLIINLDGDEAWPDLKDKEIIHLGDDAPPIRISALSGGMKSGRPSVAIRIDLPGNKSIVAETSMRLFLAAARTFEARYGEEANDGTG